jgi:hypothetical protein
MSHTFLGSYSLHLKHPSSAIDLEGLQHNMIFIALLISLFACLQVARGQLPLNIINNPGASSASGSPTASASGSSAAPASESPASSVSRGFSASSASGVSASSASGVSASSASGVSASSASGVYASSAVPVPSLRSLQRSQGLTTMVAAKLTSKPESCGSIRLFCDLSDSRPDLLIECLFVHRAATV